MRGIGWLEEFASDLRYASRQFLKHKSFFAVAVVTLALAIGANTAIFSAVDAVLLRPFPYRNPERLASILCMEPARGIPEMGYALPDLRAIAARSHAFQAVASYYWRDINITDGTPERVTGVYVSANLFRLLGVNPSIGRTFSSSEEIFGKNHVVILSHTLWRERFAGSSRAIGKTIHLNGEICTVVGVMPPDFQFPDQSAKLWMPMSFAPNDDMATRDNRFLAAIARLRAGVSIPQAKADTQSIARQLQHEVSENADVEADAQDYLSSMVGEVRPVLLILLGAAGIVLLIACVNVANLLLSRSSARQRELSVRAALGAGRGRLIRQLLTEGVLLGAAGGCLGVALSAWLMRLIRIYGPTDIPRLHTIQIDASVLVFTAAVTLLSVLLFGLTPAMRLVRVEVSEALKEGSRSLTAGVRMRRSRDVLVIAEITLSLVLVIGAGLLLQTLRRLQQVNPGFKPENVLTTSVTLPQGKYDQPQSVRFFDELTERLKRVPGVKYAGAASAMPITGEGGRGKYFTVEERPASRLSDVPVIQYRGVTPQFAKALGIPIVRGRFFTDDDSGGRPLVAVINESARRRFFPIEDPIGKRVYTSPPDAIMAKLLASPDYKAQRITIVGVVGDLKQSGLSRPSEPALFVPYLQQGTANKLFLFIKTDSDPLHFVNTARGIVRSLDPEQPVADVATMQQRLKTALATQRFQLVLFGGFAALALVLAGVGVYGVLSYSVRLRLHEIGIRMALGAGASDVLKMVARQGLALGLIGILAGAVLALGATRLMASLLFGVQADDSLTFLCASFLLMVVVSAASLVPSLRAAQTDPLLILRAE